MVVIVAPDGQLPADIGQAVKQLFVEEFIAQRASETGHLEKPVAFDGLR